MYWDYERYNTETGDVEMCPINDDNGEVTGHVVVGLKTWFDENPEVRIQQGWTKHIHYGFKNDPDKFPEYDSQTHYLVTLKNQIDDYTIEDTYQVLPKSEEMLRLEEILQVIGWGGTTSRILFGGVQ